MFFLQAEDGIRDLGRSRGLGDVYKRQGDISSIDNVTIEPGVDLFSQNPTKQSDGTWKGVVGSSTPNGDTGYNVQYTLNGISYSQDPKLRIKQ